MEDTHKVDAESRQMIAGCHIVYGIGVLSIALGGA